MKCAIISNERAPVVPFLSQLWRRLEGGWVGVGMVAVSPVELPWSANQSEFMSMVVCVCVLLPATQ